MFNFISRTSSDSIKIDTGQQNLTQIFQRLDHIAQLAPYDGAYIKRSDGGWQYAIVMETSNDPEKMFIKFLLDDVGHTKVIPATKWAALVRLERSVQETLDPCFWSEHANWARRNSSISAPNGPKQEHQKRRWHSDGLKPDPPSQSETLEDTRLEPTNGGETADNALSMLLGLQKRQAGSTHGGSDPSSRSTEIAREGAPASSRKQGSKKPESCDELHIGYVDEKKSGSKNHKPPSETVPVRRRRSATDAIDPNLCSMIAVASDTEDSNPEVVRTRRGISLDSIPNLECVDEKESAPTNHKPPSETVPVRRRRSATDAIDPNLCSMIAVASDTEDSNPEVVRTRRGISLDSIPNLECVDEKESTPTNHKPLSESKPVRRRRSSSDAIDPDLCSMKAVAPDTVYSSERVVQTRRAFSLDSIDSERRSKGDAESLFKKSMSWSTDDSDQATNDSWDKFDETKSTSGDTQTDAGSFSVFKAFFGECCASTQTENKPKIPRDVAAHLKNSDREDSTLLGGSFDYADHKSSINQARTSITDEADKEPLSWIGLFEEEFRVATKMPHAKSLNAKESRGKHKERKKRGSSSSHQRAFLSALATIENKMEKSRSTGDLSVF